MTATGARRAVNGLLACGGVIAAAMVALAFVDAAERPALFVACALVAGAGYLLALGLLGRVRGGGTRGLALCLVLAAFWRVPLLLQAPRLSSDVYRYVWDGRLQRLGEDPYRIVPDDAAAARLHTPVTRQLNNGWVPTPYPPGAQLFFRGVTAIEESARSFKGTLVVCDALVLLVVLSLLAATGRSAWWSLAYAWNPLVALEGAGNGHVDLLGTLALVVAVWSLVRRWRTVAALAFALAVGIKLIPIVLAPLFWRRLRVGDVVAGSALLGALYLPFVHQGRFPLGSLGAYLAYWRFNGPFFAALQPLASPTTLAALAVLAGLVVAMWARARLPIDSAAAWAWPVAAVVALGPSVYPWYLLWLTPFLFTPATRPLAVWTVTILPTYVALHLERVHGTWGLPWWLVAAEYGAVPAAAVVGLRLAGARWRGAIDDPAKGGTSMTNPSRVTTMRVLGLGLLMLAATSSAESRPAIVEQVAKAYGLDSFGKIEAIRYTLNLDLGAVKVSRAWIWEPKTDRVSYEGKDKEGKAVKVTYLRSELGSQPAAVQDEVDPAFVNDNYWLLFPFHVSWDGSAQVEDTGMHELPLGKGSAERVLVKYPADGGYTPGDTWELYIGPDHRIREFIYHRGGPKKPSVVVTTWADYKKAGPLLVSMDHRGTADGGPVRVFLSDVSVKLAGSNTWMKAQ